MNLEESLLKMKKLEHDLSILEKENESQRLLIYKQQKKLNELLGEKEVIRQKLVIEQIKPFVSKSEKIKDIVVNEVEEVLQNAKQQIKKKGRKRGGKNFANVDLSSASVETRYEDPDSLICPTCSSMLKLASQKERYVIEVIPSTIKVIKIIKRSYKCPLDGTFIYPLSNEVFPGTILTPSLASYLAYYKYELGIPFHHLEKHLQNVLNFPLSKQLLAHWMESLAFKLTPLYEKMKDDLVQNSVKVIHADETTLVVSKKPESETSRKKSYVYVYASSYFDRQIHLYDFHESRKIDQTTKWLKDYKGYLICDDYPGYDKLRKECPLIKLQRCWSHARRRFSDILKAIPEEKKTKTTSYKILTLINELFAFEATYKKEGLLPKEVLIRRHKDHKPIIEQLRVYVFDTPLAPNSAFESAVKYVRKIFDDLLTYLENPYLEISNNLAERAVRPFVINRKVFMTSDSYAGAKYTTIIFSIIRTAYINHLDVQKYLLYVLNNLHKLETSELVPYAVSLPKSLKI